MLGQLPSVFLDVVAPVFAIVALGWALGPRLALEARTVSRAAYYVFVPAFTFDVIARSAVPLGDAARMVTFAVVAHAAFALVGFGVARALRRSREVTAAYVMLAVFGNVGNFGLALVQFRFGEGALAPATIYYIAILVTSFVICVGAAAWVRGGHLSAVGSVLRTPALWVVPPAMLVAGGLVALPLSVSRSVGLLGGAMIPTMLLALGLQLAEAGRLRVTPDVVAVTVLRLVAAPLVAAAIVGSFRLGDLERATGILQSGTPAAILVAIIAVEHDIAPPFVTTAVIFSTICSLPTLTVLLALV
ncbi:MAG TPA: AEC family transporter [Anaeromyxobacter sp.]|nr:AEC family transporter [Anaeromyxobacter sp.]